MLGDVLFDYGIIGNPLPLLVTLALSANLGVVLGLLTFLGSMPLALPSNRVKQEDIVRVKKIYVLSFQDSPRVFVLSFPT